MTGSFGISPQLRNLLYTAAGGGDITKGQEGCLPVRSHLGIPTSARQLLPMRDFALRTAGFLVCWQVCLLASAAPKAEVNFTRDVVPALTKAGCNMGACHGSLQGRGGMALSLLGF